MATVYYLNATDILVRRQLLADYIAEFAGNVAKQYQQGQKCANKNFRKLALLVGYEEVMSCYQPITGNVTEEDNCITEEQAQNIFDHVITLTGLNFASIGATYIS